MKRMVKKSQRKDCTVSIKQFLYHGKNGEIFFFFKEPDPEYYNAYMKAEDMQARRRIKDNREMKMGILNLDDLDAVRSPSPSKKGKLNVYEALAAVAAPESKEHENFYTLPIKKNSLFEQMIT